MLLNFKCISKISKMFFSLQTAKFLLLLLPEFYFNFLNFKPKTVWVKYEQVFCMLALYLNGSRLRHFESNQSQIVTFVITADIS